MKIFQVDAFADRPFKGNPAAICIMDQEMPDSWMQGLAADMNLSETAFLRKTGDVYSLRWFTPKVEVDLCGHATLASAHVLWEKDYLSINEIAKFQTKSGLLTAKKDNEWIELNFPETPVSAVEIPKGMEENLGAKIIFMGKSKFDYFAELESEDVVKKLIPDFGQLAKFEVRGIIITAKSGSYDFVSRFFAPHAGINEDPVTGSAHSALYPYWSNKLDKKELHAFQTSERGGELKLNSDKGRVLIAGKAITIFDGNLKI